MQFAKIVESRYASKHFDGRKIPNDRLEQLLELIRLAPTSYNLQPWQVVVVADTSQKVALAEAAWNQPQIASCSHLLVFCTNLRLEHLADRLEARMLEADMPERSVGGYMDMLRRSIAGLGDQRLAWASRQVYLALANGLNGARSLGLDSCPMEGFEPSALARCLNLPDHLVPTVLLPVGYANDSRRPKLRFKRDEMFVEVA